MKLSYKMNPTTKTILNEIAIRAAQLASGDLNVDEKQIGIEILQLVKEAEHAAQ